MKTLRQLSASALLIFALALPAFAGDMHSPVVAPPPPPKTSEETAQPDATMGGAILSGETGELDPLTEATLLMLQGVLALF